MAMRIKPGRMINEAGLGQGTGAAIPRRLRKSRTTRTTRRLRKSRTTRTTRTTRRLRTAAMSIKPVTTIRAIGLDRGTAAVIIIIKPIPVAGTAMEMEIMPKPEMIGDPGAVVVITAIKGMIGGAVRATAGGITAIKGMIGDLGAAQGIGAVMPIEIGRGATGILGTSRGIKTIKPEAQTGRGVARMPVGGQTATITITKNLIKSRSGAGAVLNTAAQAGTVLKKTSRLGPQNPTTKSLNTAISRAPNLSTIPTMGATPTTRGLRKLDLPTAGLTTMS